MCVSEVGWCCSAPQCLFLLIFHTTFAALALPAEVLGKNTHGHTGGIADTAQQLPPERSDGRMPVSLSSVFFGR